MMSAEPGPAPHVRRNGGRKSTACRRCHRQKVKCTKETPCRNCRTAKVECIYAARDDTLTVSRSYLRSLEADRDRRRWRPRSPLPASDTTRDEDASLHAGRYGGEAPSPQQTVENSAAEAFLAKVNQLRQTATFSAVADPAPDDGGGEPSGVETGAALPPSTYEYFHLDFDTSCPPISLRLPPYPYAIHLLDEFEIYLGHDYHWFMRRRFKQRMERTYKSSDLPESRDRLWLCRLLIVFALGETYIKYPAPVIHLGSAAAAAATGADGSTAGRGHDDPALATPALPGTAFFEQALALLKLPCEETDLEHIEVINLATFYSYSLNRKRAAYSYAGIGARMCNLLRLHQPPPPQGGQGLSAAEQEHRKRVCWTSYCLDKMTSSELGLLPSFQPGQIKVDLPRDDQLRPEDAAEFHEAEFLRARIQLTFMKAEADVVIDLWTSIRDDIPDVERRVRPILLRLEDWLRNLPSHMSFDCEAGMPDSMTRAPTMRSIASSYLRYHQCFILLLRPLFLKHITYIISDDLDPAPPQVENLKSFSNTCLKAARTNLSILVGLWQRDKIAKLGFWDSTHLFSSLTIFSLAMSVNRGRPGSFDERTTDWATYLQCKDLLREMARAGNLASRGYEKMLLDVEALGEVLGAAHAGGPEFAIDQWDMDNWMEQVLGLDSVSMHLGGMG